MSEITWRLWTDSNSGYSSGNSSGNYYTYITTGTGSSDMILHIPYPNPFEHYVYEMDDEEDSEPVDETISSTCD